MGEGVWGRAARRLHASTKSGSACAPTTPKAHPRLTPTHPVQVWNESFAFNGVTEEQVLKIEVRGRGHARARPAAGGDALCVARRVSRSTGCERT